MPSEQLDSVTSGGLPLPEQRVQVEGAPTAGVEQRFPAASQDAPGVAPEGWHAVSWQSVRPLQLLSTPSLQISVAPPRQVQSPEAQVFPTLPLLSQDRAPQAVSAQSTLPLQSLSNPSPQLVSVASATPPFPEQPQVPPASAMHDLPKGPQACPGAPTVGWQFRSAQSTFPLQSLSTPSLQVVSTVWPPGQTEQVFAAASQVSPKGLQARPPQLGSWQSTRPLQSLSFPSPQLVSRTSGAPPLPEQTVQADGPGAPFTEQVCPAGVADGPGLIPDRLALGVGAVHEAVAVVVHAVVADLGRPPGAGGARRGRVGAAGVSKGVADEADARRPRRRSGRTDRRRNW